MSSKNKNINMDKKPHPYMTFSTKPSIALMAEADIPIGVKKMATFR